jgi:hypothetical protein
VAAGGRGRARIGLRVIRESPLIFQSNLRFGRPFPRFFPHEKARWRGRRREPFVQRRAPQHLRASASKGMKGPRGCAPREPSATSQDSDPQEPPRFTGAPDAHSQIGPSHSQRGGLAAVRRDGQSAPMRLHPFQLLAKRLNDGAGTLPVQVRSVQLSTVACAARSDHARRAIAPRGRAYCTQIMFCQLKSDMLAMPSSTIPVSSVPLPLRSPNR